MLQRSITNSKQAPAPTTYQNTETVRILKLRFTGPVHLQKEMQLRSKAVSALLPQKGGALEEMKSTLISDESTSEDAGLKRQTPSALTQGCT